MFRFVGLPNFYLQKLIFSYNQLGGCGNNNNNCYANGNGGQGYKDWVFINYTFKRFEGLTQRGHIPLTPLVSHSPSSSST